MFRGQVTLSIVLSVKAGKGSQVGQNVLRTTPLAVLALSLTWPEALEGFSTGDDHRSFVSRPMPIFYG